MAITPTTLLSLPLITTGTESGNWGDDVNNGLTQYLDISIAGTLALTSASFTANALTLSNTAGTYLVTNIGASTAQYYILSISSLAASVTITAPGSSRSYIVNNLDTTYNVTIKASGQTGVIIYPGEKAIVAFSSTDYVKVSSYVGVAALQLPKGTTGQQPTGVSGMLRFNTTTTQFEGYNGSTWASVGGAAISNDTTTSTNEYPLFAAATSGTALTVYTSNAKLLYKPSTGDFQSEQLVAGNGLIINNQTINTSYSVPATQSAMSTGPITLASAVSVTLASGARWVIL
jgi:hypothetical protein